MKVAWVVSDQGRFMETPVCCWHFFMRFSTDLCCLHVLWARELLAESSRMAWRSAGMSSTPPRLEMWEVVKAPWCAEYFPCSVGTLLF